MDTATRKRVDALLEAGFAASGLLDSREVYRNALRDLRVQDQAMYERAASYFADTVVPAIVAGGDAVEVWIEYGGFLGSLAAAGTLMSIDPTGRAVKYSSPMRSGDMVLFMPDGGRTGTFAVARPVEPSAAQAAAAGLLVEGWLTLPKTAAAD